MPPKNFGEKNVSFFPGTCLAGASRLDVSRRADHFEIGRGDGHAGNASESGKGRVRRVSDVENVKERRKEKEKFFLGEVVAEAHSLPDAERHEVFRLFDGFSVLGEEPLRPEGLGLLPVIGVHVDGMKERNDVSVLGNDVAFEMNRSAKKI